jgi:hypothetical protein
MSWCGPELRGVGNGALGAVNGIVLGAATAAWRNEDSRHLDSTVAISMREWERRSSADLFGPVSRERSRDSSVGIATGYGLDDQEWREFESR